MALSFVKKISDKEYTFYRTVPGDETVYIIIYNKNGKRDSFKIQKNLHGSWHLPNEAGEEVRGTAFDFISAIVENEEG